MYKLLFGNTFSAMDGHASCEREQRASLSQRPDTAGYECRRLDKFMATQNQLTDVITRQAVFRYERQNPGAYKKYALSHGGRRGKQG